MSIIAEELPVAPEVLAIPKCPSKVDCFSWLVCRKACLTHEALQKRGWQFCSRSVMCEQETEVNDHLFLHCKAAMSLWNMFFYLLGVKQVMPSTTKELLNNWNGIGNRGRKEYRKEHWWRTIPASSGGLFGKKGIQGVLMDRRLIYRRLK